MGSKMGGGEPRVFRLVSNSVGDTQSIGEAVGSECQGGEVILLHGPLGAGKTAFAQGIARGLGVQGPVQSPSFVLERIHHGRLVFRHLDLYRLGPGEAQDLGLLESRDQEVIAVEWGERVGQLDDAMHIRVEPVSGMPDSRTITAKVRGPNWERLFGEMEAHCGK